MSIVILFQLILNPDSIERCTVQSFIKAISVPSNYLIIYCDFGRTPL